jgi:hypothetical protein
MARRGIKQDAYDIGQNSASSKSGTGGGARHRVALAPRVASNNRAHGARGRRHNQNNFSNTRMRRGNVCALRIEQRQQNKHHQRRQKA